MTGFRTYFAMAALAASAAVWPAHAQAAEPRPQKSAIRSNCRSDFMSKCSSVTPGGTEAFQCLKKNEATLSGGCRAAVSAIKLPGETPAAAAPAPAAPKPAAAAPAPAPAAAAPKPAEPAAAVATPAKPSKARADKTRSAAETGRAPPRRPRPHRLPRRRPAATGPKLEPATGSASGAHVLHRGFPDTLQRRADRRRPGDQMPVGQSAGAFAGCKTAIAKIQ